MGSKDSTSTSTYTPPPEVMAAYKDLLAKANPVAATPYQAYTGGVNGSGFEQNQLTGFQNIANLAGASNPYFSSAASALNASTTPTYATVGQYMSPYLQNVVDATTANMAEQNGQQQQQVIGNAIAQGALGGNRVGVAQSELARQQNLANQQTIAGLYNTGYNNALGAAQSQQAAQQAAAQGYASLGQNAMQTNLAQAAAQVGAGTQQQQYNYQQYQNQLSYPFQTLGWLASIVEGAGAGMGGTQTTTQPSGNSGSSILGGLLGIGSLFLNRGGAVHDEERPRRAQGGVIPYTGSSGIMSMNDNAKPAANDNGYVPEVATGTTGHSTMPNSPTPTPTQAQDPMLQQGMKSMEGAIRKDYPNGVLAGMNTVNLPDQAPIPTPNPLTGEAGLPAPVGDTGMGGGLLSGLASLFGFKDGGVIRGYDVGGGVGSVGGGIGGHGGNYQGNQQKIDPQQMYSQWGVPGSYDSNTGMARSYFLGLPMFLGKNFVPMDTSQGGGAGFGALALAKGGVASRRGYDAGGAIDDDPLLDNIRAFLGASDASPLTDQQFNDRAGATTNAPMPGVVPGGALADFGDHGPVPQPLSEDQRAAIRARDEANLANFGDNVPPVGVVADRPLPPEFGNKGITPDQWAAMNAPDGGGVVSAAPTGVAQPLPTRDVEDRPIAPSVPEYKPQRVSKYSPAFNQINDQYGLPAGYLNQTAYIESGFNPNADNGIARGAFQFTGPTAKQYGLSNPFDPIASAQAAAKLASDNSKFLTGGLGRQPTAGELYLAHQQGAAGALNLLTHPDAPATDIVGRAAVVQNGGSPDMTAAQFANLWTNRFNSVSPNSSSDSTVLRMADNGIDSGQTGSTSKGILVGPQPSDDARGILSSIFNGERPHISDDMRMALLSAGLGMMAGTSPNFGTNVGTGGLQGLKTYMEKQQLNRENAQAQSEIATRAGNLGLEGQRVDIAGKQLALEAQRNAADIANTTEQTAKTRQEVQIGRYAVTPGPAGFVVRDATNPMEPPRLITYDQMQGIQTSGDAAQPAASSPASAIPSAPAPASSAESDRGPRVAATPVTPVGSVPQGVFTTQAPARIPVDPRLYSMPDIVKNETQGGLDAARKDYQGAINTQTQLSEMQHDLGQIQNSTWTSPGTGFENRVKWARAVNTGFNALGIAPPIDENAVASGENLNKLTTRLGFSLSSSLGSGEAANIVNQAVASVPGGANSKEGAARIISGIQAANQRKLDYYNFLQDWSAKGYGSIKGADQAFNRSNPPELYALASYVPSGAIQALRADPSLAPQFEQKYGTGTSKYVLGTQ